MINRNHRMIHMMIASLVPLILRINLLRLLHRRRHVCGVNGSRSILLLIALVSYVPRPRQPASRRARQTQPRRRFRACICKGLTARMLHSFVRGVYDVRGCVLLAVFYKGRLRPLIPTELPNRTPRILLIKMSNRRRPHTAHLKPVRHQRPL